MNHITAKRMWDYVRMRTELGVEEESHISECDDCLNLFKRCVLADSPESLDLDDQTQKRSA